MFFSNNCFFSSSFLHFCFVSFTLLCEAYKHLQNIIYCYFTKVFVDEKMSIYCANWWWSSLARDKSHLRLWRSKEQLFIIHIHKLQVSAFQLQPAVNVPSLANDNHVLLYFQLLRFLFTYLFVTLKVSICIVSLCCRVIQMLLPVQTPNQTDWPQSVSSLGRQLLRGIPHLPFLSHLIPNDSAYPLKRSDFCTDHPQSGTSFMDQPLEEKNLSLITQYRFADNTTYVAEQSSVSDSKNLLENG